MDEKTGTIILAAALAVSEALSLIPWIKSNGILQLIFHVINFIAGKKPGNRRKL